VVYPGALVNPFDVPLFQVRTKRIEGPEVAAIRMLVLGGARTEKRPGECVLTGAMLDEGTESSDWREFAERVEEFGMDFAGFADYDGHGVGVDAMARDVDRALDLAFESLSQPAFGEDRLRGIREQERRVLLSIEESPEALTAWTFLGAVHASGRRALPLQGRAGSLAEVSSDQCRSYHASRLRSGVVVAVAGMIDEDAVRRAVRTLFSRATELAPVPPPFAGELPSRAVIEVETPASEQAHIYVGHRTATKSSRDRVGLLLLGTILGGGAGNVGRLPTRLREGSGWAYSTYAAMMESAGIDPGHLVLYAGTAERNIDRVVGAMEEELERILETRVSRRELADAKSFLLGREPFRHETGRQWASRLVEEELFGELSAETFVREISRWTPTELRELAQETVCREALQTVVGVPS